MKRFTLCLLLTLVVPISALAGEPVRATYRERLAGPIDREVDARWGDWFAYYKDLHQHPELSMKEHESARKIAERFEAMGYSVTRGVGETGVVGVMTNGAGPTVLIRGDMDALPIVEDTNVPYRSTVKVPGANGGTVGVMHACGHDVHQVCLVGTAQVLASTRDKWKGTVLLVAQPGEEIGKGARLMIEDGLFDRFPRPDYCIALHVAAALPAGRIGVTSGWALANVDSVDITIHGLGGHGSRPHEAIDPVLAAAQVIVSLQSIVSRRVDPLKDAVITVGSIHAGSKHNIISDTAKLQLTVRSYTDETRKILLDGIREVTLHTCRAMGCAKDPDIVIRDDEFTPASYNDPALTAAAMEVMRRVVGEDGVTVEKPRMGGEDFGRYARHLKVPGFMFFLGSVHKDKYDASLHGGPPLPSVHSATYVPDPEPTIKTGVKCLASLALALLDSTGE